MADVGRPIEYEPLKHPAAVTKYVADCKKAHYLPTIEGLAVHLIVARSTLYKWGDTYPKFSDILEQLKAAQASQLIQKGLKNEYNASITKLMLTKHGYTDRQEVTGKDGEPLFDDQSKDKADRAVVAFLKGDTSEGK